MNAPNSLTLILLVTILALLAFPASAETFDRPHIYGVGIMWDHWLKPGMIPPKYRDDPRTYNQAQLEMIKKAGGTATHGSFDWSGIEPERGKYDWTKADERVTDTVAAGLVAYAYIGHCPDWARADTSLPGYRTPPAEEFVEDFERYCTAVASRYKGRVDHFFFWNEPNGCSWVNDGCGNMDGYPLYTKWLKRAYTALKKGNPDCVVAAGVLDYNEGVDKGYEYVEGMYREGAQGYFDAIAIHPYNKHGGIHWRAIHDTRRVMVEHGDSEKEMWINEYGWHNSRTQTAANDLKAFLTEVRKPEYDYITYCRYLIVTDLPDGGYGMCERSLAPRPIYTAFAELDKGEPPLRQVSTLPASGAIDLLSGSEEEGAAIQWQGVTIFRMNDPETGMSRNRVMFPRGHASENPIQVVLLGPVAVLKNFDSLELEWKSTDDTPIALTLETWNGPDTQRFTKEIPVGEDGKKAVSVSLKPEDLQVAEGDVEAHKDSPVGMRIVFRGYAEGMHLTNLTLNPAQDTQP